MLTQLCARFGIVMAYSFAWLLYSTLTWDFSKLSSSPSASISRCNKGINAFVDLVVDVF